MRDPLFPDEMHAARFDVVCSWLASWFNVLPLDEAAAHLMSGTLPARAACITFDDGYFDNYDIAQPILLRHGLSATFFIATGFLDGGRMWNDTVIESVRRSVKTRLDLGDMGSFELGTLAEKAAAIDSVIRTIKYLPVDERLAATKNVAEAAEVQPPEDLMMTSAQVKAMRHAGMLIGAHTLTHPILARLGDAEADAEIRGSKEYLERLLGERIGLFAYPNGKPGGDYSPATVNIVRKIGFDAAVSTQWGAARCGSDILQLPRFTPWDTERPRFGLRLMKNILAP